jgi:2-polyprenyl-3-methyl-5-hydroxy-6-metoxy-1,4-benzoquinol methylase
MDSDTGNDARIIDSWHSNAAPWTVAVREGQIESRRVTDRAIIEAIVSQAPRTMLDIGCGEGWLARALAARGIHCTGIDVVPALIEQARRAGGAEFRTGSYEQLALERGAARVDLAACNFSLLGRHSVDGLLHAMPSLLNPRGRLVIQTLHPVLTCGAHPYQDGWREGSWLGFDSAFVDPPPWYFRTLESWIRLIGMSGLRLLELREPLHPLSRQPLSVIFIAAPE